MHSLLKLHILFSIYRLTESRLVAGSEHVAHQKRDDGVATVNIGALSDYGKTITDGPTPTGKDTALYPTDIKNIPSNGAEFRLGGDVPGLVDQAWTSECSQSHTDEKCVKAIDDIMQGQSKLARRQFGEGVGAVVALAGAIALGQKALEPAKPIPVDIHLEPSVLSAIDSASAATEMVFETATDDKNAITAAVAASKTDAAAGPLKTLDADADGHHKGDLEVDIPDAQLQSVKAFLDKENCKAPKLKRETQLSKRVDTILDCLRDSTVDILEALGINQPLHGLADQAMQVAETFQMPNIPDPAYAGAFTQALFAGGDILPGVLNGIRRDQIPRVTLMTFAMAAAHAIQQAIDIHIILSDIAKFDKPWQPNCPAEDDPNYPHCSSNLCEGKDGKCTYILTAGCGCSADRTDCPNTDKPLCSACGSRGQKCNTGDHKGCQCVEDGEIIDFTIDDRDWIDAKHQFFIDSGNSGPDDDTAGTAPVCDKDKISQIQNRLFNDGNGNTLYKNFCDAVGKDTKTALTQVVDASGNVVTPKNKRWSSRIMKRTPPPDPDAETKAGNTFKLEWEGGDGSCNSDCNTFFDKIVASPCAKNGGEQNQMALSGSIDTGCGKYTYTIKPGKPSPGPIVCRAGEYKDKDQHTVRYKDIYMENGCWSEIHGDSVDGCIDNIGAKIALVNGDYTVNSKMKNVTNFYREGGGTKGITYMVNIGWKPGCTDFDTIVADNPMGNHGDPASVSISCTDIIKGVYNKCRWDKGNDGLGGFQDYGCLRYGFYPSWHPEMWKSGDASPYWKGKELVCPISDCGDCENINVVTDSTPWVGN